MVYGAILEEGEMYYTYLRKIFNAIGNKQNEYNWLITSCECYPQTKGLYQLLSHEYSWFSGNELTKMVEKEDFQWIWAVLSGFEKNIPLNNILEYPYPWADGNRKFWVNPVSIQHPLASVEIVAFDSSLTLFMSTKKELVDSFMKAFPKSEDLSEYNAK